jgi:hypothetical protein
MPMVGSSWLLLWVKNNKRRFVALRLAGSLVAAHIIFLVLTLSHLFFKTGTTNRIFLLLHAARS